MGCKEPKNGVGSIRSDPVFNRSDPVFNKAKRYSNIKYSLSIAGSIYVFILLFLFLKLGFSSRIFNLLSDNLPKLLTLPAYLTIVFLIYFFLNLPFSFYQSYILEHKFSLSNQTFKDWWNDQVKGGIVSFIISLVIISFFYFFLARFPYGWWLAVSVFWVFFSVILAKVMPVAIIPLFFKYKRLTDQPLRERILRLAEKMNVKLIDCFEIDFSKKTMKANAAFVGIGKTRRVILSDTLKDKYSDEEIEVILAHEFAHYQLKHLSKLIAFNSFFTMLFFYLIFKTSDSVLPFFGFSSLSQISALPVIIIYFLLFGVIVQPLEAFISRSFERSADFRALEVTDLKEAFVSTMDKLARQNLADRSPHPIIKFFFFDHPPIEERIKSAMGNGFSGSNS